MLKIRAAFNDVTLMSGQKAFVDVKVFVVNYQEKSQLVFKHAPKTQFIDTLTFIKK
jgi:sRNA-binding regulator protein Hfq